MRRLSAPSAGLAIASRGVVVSDHVSTSVFGKLVAIMVTMAACLLLLVGGFFVYIVSPAVATSIDRVLEEHARTIAATMPDLDAAKRLGAPLNLEVRYEGPAGSWSTASDLPTIQEAERTRRNRKAPLLQARHYYIASGPQGGSYLFAWSAPPGMQAAHVMLLVLLLLLMTAVLVTAHAVLNRLLRPLRGLS